MRHGLFAQVLLAVAGLFALAGVLTYALASARIAAAVRAQTGAELRQRLTLLERRLGPAPPAGRSEALQEEVRQLGHDLEARFTLIAADGLVLAESHRNPEATDNHATRPEVQAALAGGEGTSLRHSTTLNRPMLYVARRLTAADGSVRILRAARPLDALEERQGELLRSVLLAEAVAALLALGLAGLLARRISRPLADLTEAADAIAAGGAGRRALVQGGVETRRLARAFNAMADRVERDLATIRHDRMELATVLSGIVEGVVALDADERVVLMNRAAGRIFGLDPDAVRGQPLWSVLRLPAVQEGVAAAQRARAPSTREVHLVEGGRERVLLLEASPLRDADGPSQGIVLLARDVTEARRLERTRRDFVANASHELKTPVAAIRGLAETILADERIDAATARRFVLRILAQAERMQRLVQEMLTLSRAEAGQEGAGAARTDLRTALEQALETFGAAAHGRAVTIAYDPPAHPLEVAAAREPLERIAGNLLDNAVKFAPAGSAVTVTLDRDGAFARLRVADQGPGIPAELHTRIFERFFRVDEGRSREEGGTGLGLAIVKHLAQALGGRVGLESASGRGSRFSVWLPLAAAPGGAAPARAAAPGRP